MDIEGKRDTNSAERPLIAHLTSVHARRDVRIFEKECKSLSAAGYDVMLFVADGLGNANEDGITVIDCGRPRNRVARMFRVPRNMFRLVVERRPELVHLHDPELLQIGPKLRKAGIRVVFDSHENLPDQIYSKHYLPTMIRKPLSFIVAALERLLCSNVDAVVAATPCIGEKFRALGMRTIEVRNFPIPEEFQAENWTKGPDPIACYVGGIERARGIIELIEAIGRCKSNVKLHLAGEFSEHGFHSELEAMPAWSRVTHLGFLPRLQVATEMRGATVGMVTLMPTRAYLQSLPVKMFEYMASALPVIASDFPLWKEIVLRNNCGLCVDPRNPDAIAEAIDYMVDNPDIANQMGRNGYEAVKKMFNWNTEKSSLLGLYGKVLSERLR